MIEEAYTKEEETEEANFIFKRYLKVFKYIWENCALYPNIYEIKYTDKAATFIYKIGNVSLQVLISNKNKIFYELKFNKEKKKYVFPIKDDFSTYQDYQYYYVYHFERLLNACLAASVLKSKEHRMNNVDDVYRYYERSL